MKKLSVYISIHLNLTCHPKRGLEVNIAFYGQVNNLSVDIAIHLNLTCFPRGGVLEKTKRVMVN